MLSVAQLECKNCRAESKFISTDVLVGKVLKYLKDLAQDYIDRKLKPFAEQCSLDTYQVSEVVLGIPATYSDHQRDVLRSAAQLAGFEEVCFGRTTTPT